ncbi:MULTISPECIES: HipA domain-containing protein [unclassified Bosea (in: a-proteobacteria)]|uniref:HipA domain-containing protein n=1 Tax=unclassified Bosea (in: a-proteobacteria) TaxID=2653178 RepID=UPI0013DE86A6|nr:MULTISPECIES: HipA domain-containing protein [unclassified Bosea (in: a-proteobacteria)]
MKLQPPGAPILIGAWSRDDDFAIHPVGSKPKRTVICPEAETRPFLIPSHTYLFKIATGWKAQQLWAEVIAYQIGCLVGLTVPPAFLAYDERTGELGVLIEFFYGFPGEAEPARFFHGIDFIRRFREASNGDRPHDLRTNISICRAYRVPNHLEWWARTLAFDALIGNTDRHTENWGFLIRSRPGRGHHYELAPVYDNGTSLGFQQADLKKLLEPGAMAGFIAKGLHHCGWDRNTDAPTPHMDLCEKLAVASAIAGAAMRNVIRFGEDDLRSLVSRNVCAEIDVPFCTERAELVTAIVLARRARLSAVLGE